jgi:hypothetical protein
MDILLQIRVLDEVTKKASGHVAAMDTSWSADCF